MARPASGMIAVATPIVGDVQIRRHQLDCEAAALANMCHKVRRRLNRWLKQMPEEIAAMRAMGRIDDDGNPLLEPVCGPDGKMLLEPLLPGEDWRETFRWYQSAVLGLLKEQRERAKLVKGAGAPPLNDDEYAAELELIEQQAVLEMPKERLEELLRRRGAIDVAVGDPVKRDPRDDL